MKKAYIGKWSIEEMEAWDKDFIDLVVPGHFTIRKDAQGEFQFGAVEGNMDCRIEKRGETERLEFSWEGSDEGDLVSGRGWAVLNDNELHGRLYFHLGDDSSFIAKKRR